MDYLKPGLLEIRRKAVRQLSRARLALARRERAKALTHLGLLGWQQADFDAETQRQVDEIQNVEREQSRAVNLAAETAREILRLTAERETAQKAHGENRKQLELELRKANEGKTQLERQVSEKRKVEPNFERHIPELDRELREVNRLYAELLVQERQTPKMKQDLVRLRERIVAIPNEKSDLRTQHLRAVTELRTLEESLAQQAEAAAAAQQRLHFAESQWQTKNASLAAEIKAKEKEKAAAERHLRELEAAKTNPYLRIGEVLAASGIAPVNQPETLDKVREVDVSMALLEERISSSLAETGQEDQRLLQTSLLLWAIIAALLLLFTWLYLQ